MDHLVLTSDADRVRTIQLNRPERLNAFTPELYRALADALGAAATDADVSVAVLTGTGRAFSAGVDLGVLAAPGGGAALAPAFDAMLDALDRFPKPLIGAVNGLATGVGATLLLHTDLIAMADSARLQFPFTAMGLSPEAASSVLLAGRVGSQQAAWMMFSAEWIDAATALATGLAWCRLPDAQFIAGVAERAARIASRPLTSLVETKALLTAGRCDAIAAALVRENEAMVRTAASAEHRAFLARFAPG